jgi:hypothetical protein
MISIQNLSDPKLSKDMRIKSTSPISEMILCEPKDKFTRIQLWGVFGKKSHLHSSLFTKNGQTLKGLIIHMNSSIVTYEIIPHLKCL